ncbi:MAG: histidine--tRNA ligase, partial [Clostridiaceae bacterium]|nr:histidine--tRNA ligase [Clostridiaceae bacterium]
LDYYSRTVFEFVSENVGTQGTICGGGRYDGLVEELGGPQTPAVGFALGVERLLLEMESQNIKFPEESPVDLYILSFPDTISKVASLSHKLRAQDITVEYDLMNRSFKAQMKHANRVKAKYLIVLGADEINSGRAQLKRMVDGLEKEIELASLAGELLNK